MLDTARIINLFTAVETAVSMSEPLVRFIGERDERYGLSFIFLNDNTATFLWENGDKVRCVSYVVSVLRGHLAKVSLDLDVTEMFNDASLRETIRIFANG
jgi:hypothetical protein